MDGEVLQVILQVSLLVFVVSSMLAMGLDLTITQIVEPLRSGRLVAIALAANFVVVPLFGWGLGEVLSLDEGLAVGLILIATAAGAPFLPKLAQAAKGDSAFAVGLMVMLMVITVAYMPIFLPVFISGVEVNAWDIASSLIFLMLLPLALGLLARWRYEEMAKGLQPHMAQTSSLAIAVLLVAGVIVNFDDI
ncbi:MAG: bile acid:sodium symporter family protein, partial [Acidimicrobiales bacterium]